LGRNANNLADATVCAERVAIVKAVVRGGHLEEKCGPADVVRNRVRGKWNL
jgi:cytidine deaminase